MGMADETGGTDKVNGAVVFIAHPFAVAPVNKRAVSGATKKILQRIVRKACQAHRSVIHFFNLWVLL